MFSLHSSRRFALQQMISTTCTFSTTHTDTYTTLDLTTCTMLSFKSSHSVWNPLATSFLFIIDSLLSRLVSGSIMNRLANQAINIHQSTIDQPTNQSAKQVQPIDHSRSRRFPSSQASRKSRQKQRPNGTIPSAGRHVTWKSCCAPRSKLGGYGTWVLPSSEPGVWKQQAASR